MMCLDRRQPIENNFKEILFIYFVLLPHIYLALLHLSANLKCHLLLHIHQKNVSRTMPSQNDNFLHGIEGKQIADTLNLNKLPNYKRLNEKLKNISKLLYHFT